MNSASKSKNEQVYVSPLSPLGSMKVCAFVEISSAERHDRKIRSR